MGGVGFFFDGFFAGGVFEFGEEPNVFLLVGLV